MPDDQVTFRPPPPSPRAPSFAERAATDNWEVAPMPPGAVLPRELEWGKSFREGFPPIGARNSAGGIMIPPNHDAYPPPPPDWETCAECGLVHYTVRFPNTQRRILRSCIRHSSLGLPCRHVRAHGADRCSKHMPELRTPQVRRSKLRNIAEDKAKKSLAKVKVEPLGNPLDHLADLAAEALALKQHFADVVGELRQIGSVSAALRTGDVDESMTLVEFLSRRDDHGYRFTDDKGAEQLDARVQLYERALDRAEKFLVDLVKIDFEERRTRLDEARVLLMMDYTQALIRGLGRDPHDPEVESLVRGLVPILNGERKELAPVIELDPLEDAG